MLRREENSPLLVLGRHPFHFDNNCVKQAVNGRTWCKKVRDDVLDALSGECQGYPTCGSTELLRLVGKQSYIQMIGHNDRIRNMTG